MIRRLALVALAFALASCSKSEVGYDDFDRSIEKFLADNDLRGATAVIVHRDRGVLHVRGYGEFDETRISLLASASKILSVGVLVRLADQGLLDLDAPISTYLSDWGQYKTDVTVAQLVSNSSGMVGLADNPTYDKYLCSFFSADTLANCSKVIYQANDAADRVPPDTEFHYGGGQWQLAGGIAEVVSGKSWAELVEETYVQPCGLDTLAYNNHYAQAFFEGGAAAALRYPSFFDGDPSVLEPTENPNVEGGAYTTIGTYAEILLMHLRGGVCSNGTRVLSEEAVARMQVDRIGAVYGGSTGLDPTFPGYGLGWWVSRERPGLVSDAGAFGAVPWIDNERGYAVMIILEAEAVLGAELREQVRPIVESIIDGL